MGQERWKSNASILLAGAEYCPANVLVCPCGSQKTDRTDMKKETHEAYGAGASADAGRCTGKLFENYISRECGKHKRCLKCLLWRVMLRHNRDRKTVATERNPPAGSKHTMQDWCPNCPKCKEREWRMLNSKTLCLCAFVRDMVLRFCSTGL